MVDWNEMSDFGRRDTFVKTLRALESLCPGPVRIVETGTIRDERPQARHGDGWSTLAWAWFAATHGGQVYTIDIDPAAIAVCQRVTHEYASRIIYVCADSIDFLKRWSVADNGPIHLLYLDSLDYFDAEASARHHAAEIEAILHGLADTCLVLIDDTRSEPAVGLDAFPQFYGKGAEVVPFLLARQFRLEWSEEGQVLLSRGMQPLEGTMAGQRNGALATEHGISAIVHTRNEERHIVDCLQTLKGWTDEVIVCDMESVDRTVEFAGPLADRILQHPLIANFDAARNFSAAQARYPWIFFLDADERVPAELGRRIRQLVREQGHAFEAMTFPFRHYFAGRPLQCLYPGYKAPALFKAGRFRYNARPHAGAEVDGRIACFPAEDTSLAIEHLSYDSLAHYLEKLNRYTDTEAQNLFADGQTFHWRDALRHFVRDLQSYYDLGRAGEKDGVYGLLWSVLSGFYRLLQHAKLYELRDRQGQLTPVEQAAPAGVEELLSYALAIARATSPSPPIQSPSVLEGSSNDLAPLPLSHAAGEGENQAQSLILSSSDCLERAGLSAIERDDCKERRAEVQAASNPSQSPTRSPFPANEGSELGKARTARSEVVRGLGSKVVWFGPLYDPSGYGEESRNFLFALDDAGVCVGAQPIAWSQDVVDLTEQESWRLADLSAKTLAGGFVQIVQNFPMGFTRHPDARVAIGRTMFETDRLPGDWVKACNRMDFIWVPSEFNRATFAQAGVAADKLVVIPGCFDPAPYLADTAPAPRIQQIVHEGQFTFLSVFDWTLHKGWDVLLRAILTAFRPDEKVRLLLKVWSTMGYNPEQIREQAAAYSREQLGHDLLSDSRVVFVQERLTRAEMIALYKAADAFVLPSRGEGWGRPYMEAMACGLPAIGTNWSGNTAFMTAENSYLLDYEIRPVPEAGWREIPWYRGHCWAEPSVDHLQRLLRHLYEAPEGAKALGARARDEVTKCYNRSEVGRLMADAIEKALASHVA